MPSVTSRTVDGVLPRLTNSFEKCFARGERNNGVRKSPAKVKTGYPTRESHHLANPGIKVLTPPTLGIFGEIDGCRRSEDSELSAKVI